MQFGAGWVGSSRGPSALYSLCVLPAASVNVCCCCCVRKCGFDCASVQLGCMHSQLTRNKCVVCVLTWCKQEAWAVKVLPRPLLSTPPARLPATLDGAVGVTYLVLAASRHVGLLHKAWHWTLL